MFTTAMHITIMNGQLQVALREIFRAICNNASRMLMMSSCSRTKGSQRLVPLGPRRNA